MIDLNRLLKLFAARRAAKAKTKAAARLTGRTNSLIGLLRTARAELQDAGKEAAERESRVGDVVMALQARLREAEQLAASNETVIFGLREEIKVHRQTIDVLTAANVLHLDRLQAESAIATRQRAAYSPRE
jgi:hypothetical protein